MAAPHPRTRYSADGVFRDELPDFVDGGVEMREAHHRFPTRLRSGDKLIRLRHLTTERLLHQNVLAGTQRFDTPRDMQRVRRANENCIQRIVRDNCVVIPRPSRNAELFTLMFEAVLAPAADDGYLKIGALRQVWQVHSADDAACTDNTKF